eukprot:scaffold24477_cov48-Attheya_sp.AAC.2
MASAETTTKVGDLPVIRKTALLGGPGTRLPRIVESMLGWLLCLGCLTVAAYYYVLSLWRQRRRRSSRRPVADADTTKEPFVWQCLTTHRREEYDTSPKQRHDQLIYVLTKEHGVGGDDKVLRDVLRSNHVARRLASLCMRPHGEHNHTLLDTHPQLTLPHQLARIWHSLLELPNSGGAAMAVNNLKLFLIMPVYREDASEVMARLQHAWNFANQPQIGTIQVIVVNAGQCPGLEQAVSSSNNNLRQDTLLFWKQDQLKIVNHEPVGGGRGPCLNAGATAAAAENLTKGGSTSDQVVLTFCHADTKLPRGWDESIRVAFSNNHHPSTAWSCFKFGIDLHDDDTMRRPPPGILAVQTTANWRCRVYSLPYGDQVLSVRQSVFEYVGGFPDQCLMEDYELVQLLRSRQRVTILPGPPALCSPRRWQQWGVWHVTWTNSRLVRLYSSTTTNMSANVLFRLYYGRPPPARLQDPHCSFWEHNLPTLPPSPTKQPPPSHTPKNKHE